MTEQSAIVDDTQRPGTERQQALAPMTRAQAQALEDPMVREYLKIKKEINDYRTSTIQALPNFVVNNSSNILAPIHIFGEVMMFKGSNNTLVDKKALTEKFGKVRWYDYLLEPPKNIYNEVFRSGGFKGKLSDLTKPSFYKESVRNVFDLESASKLDWAEAVETAKETGKTAKLVNRWQTRSTSLGILGWGLSIIVPEAHEKPEEMARMARMYKENLPGYVGTRAFQAVDVTHWTDNKPQMTGGLVTISGLCTMLSGFRNVDRNPLTGVNSYRMNSSHSIMGIITTLAGLSLWFGTSKEESYRNFGSTMMARMAFLPTSLANRFRVKADGSFDPGRWFYTAGQASFQTHNVSNILMGGAEKNPDGTIIDQKSITTEAKKEGIENRRASRTQHEEAPEPPRVKVQEIAEHQPPVKAAAQGV